MTWIPQPLTRLAGSLLLAGALGVASSSAQVSYTTAGADLVIDFNNGLPASAATLNWVDNSTFTGWYAYRRGGTSESQGPIEQYRRTDGHSNNMRLFHWRAGSSASDGALGLRAAPESSTLYLGLRVRNNTGDTLTSVTLAYVGEQWINSNSGSNNNLAVSYRLTAPAVDGNGDFDLSSGSGWTSVTSLNFNSVHNGDGVSSRQNLNGSLAENQTAIGPVTISGITWENGEDLWFRWLDVDSSGEDHGLAVDDVTVKATGEVSEESGDILWAWSGAVTDESARVVAKVDPSNSPAVLEVKTTAGSWGSATTFNTVNRIASTSAASESLTTDLVHFDISGLAANTSYQYRVVSGANVGDTGTFTTSPEPGTALSFNIAVASCAKGASGSNYAVDHPVFTKIAARNPRIYLQLGDLHYEDISSTVKAKYHRAYDRVHQTSTQRALFHAVPIAYSWDDHDYLGNNSGGDLTGRSAVRNAYYDSVPHFPLPLKPGGSHGPIAHSFVIGRVMFIMLDTRSERFNSGNSNNEGSSSSSADVTMLGDGRTGTVDQLSWLYDQLDDFKAGYDEGDLKLCVINFGTPWVASSGTDRWAGFQVERKEISDYLVNLIGNTEIRSVIGVAGDAHMLAYDDGTNNTYATGAGPRFPMFQAAALKNSGSTKGGPYSGGTYPNPSSSYGQYGILEITDTGGSTIGVTFTGYRVTSGGSESSVTTHSFTTN